MRCRAATSARCGSTPPQASLSRSAPAWATTSPTSLRQVATLIATSGGRARTARPRRPTPPPRVALGRGRPLVAGAALPPADVDEVGAVGHGLAGRVQRGAESAGGPLVEERGGRPADHGHDAGRI